MAIEMKSAKTANESPKEAPKKASSTGASTVAKKKAPQKKEGTEKAAERKRQAEAKDAIVPVMDEFSSATKKKPESEAALQRRAREEKDEANREKLTPYEKAALNVMHEGRLETKKAAKKKAADNSKTVPQKNGDGESEKQLFKERIERIAESLSEVLAYADSFSHRAKHKEKDPKKIIYGVYLGFPEPPAYEIDLAVFLNLDRKTLYNWRLDKDVVSVRSEFVETYFRSHTPSVIQALVEGTQRRSWTNGLVDTAAIKLFLQYVEKWNEKSEVDVTSGGKAISLGLPVSQFAKVDKIPKKKEDGE